MINTVPDGALVVSALTSIDWITGGFLGNTVEGVAGR